MLCSQPIELKKGDLVRVLDVIVQPSRNGLFDTAKVELVLAIEVKDRNSEPTIYTFTVGYAEHYKFFKKNNTAPVLFNER